MAFQGDSIYWVEVEKVVPNPFQPRREFDENKLQELSESIRMYGVLQPLTVTRREVQNPGNGTFYTEYELIAGERRLRASRLAGIAQVPVIIREGEQSEQEKLELAIIENLQREDLNAVDRALAFQQLAEQFNLNHAEVGRKVGRSREYVANSIRLLQLPEHMRVALQRGELGEGHARTLLMLNDRPEEQETVFREVLLKKMSVRELERIARKIATDKVRKPNKGDIDQHLIDIEKEFTETLGTRVQIQKTEFGGKLTIDYFSEEDLAALLERVRQEQAQQSGASAAQALQQATPMAVAAAPVVQPAAPTPETGYSSTPTSDLNPVPAPVQSAPVASAQSIQPTPVPEPVAAYVLPIQPTQPPVPSPTSTAEESVAMPPQAAPVASAEVTAPTPSADPGLLERLASFTRPTPSHSSPEPVAPVVEQEPVNHVPATPSSPGQAPHISQTTTNDENNLYSMRNFTV